MIATDIFKKLRLNKEEKLLIINAPDEYIAILEGITFDKKPLAKNKGKYAFVQVFATTQTELENLVRSVEGCGEYDCLFWACYPKGTGKIKSDIKRETVWTAIDLIGLQA